jgi:hypothetical protein
MENLKDNVENFNIAYYIELSLKRVLNKVSTTDNVTKYLLFSHLTNYMGMSVPTSTILFFGGMYTAKRYEAEGDYTATKAEGDYTATKAEGDYTATKAEGDYLTSSKINPQEVVPQAVPQESSIFNYLFT